MINTLRDVSHLKRKDINGKENDEEKQEAMNTSKKAIITRFIIIDWLSWGVLIILFDIIFLLVRIFLSYFFKNLWLLDFPIVGIFMGVQLIFILVFIVSYFQEVEKFQKILDILEKYGKKYEEKYEKKFNKFFSDEAE